MNINEIKKRKSIKKLEIQYNIEEFDILDLEEKIVSSLDEIHNMYKLYLAKDADPLSIYRVKQKKLRQCLEYIKLYKKKNVQLEDTKNKIDKSKLDYEKYETYQYKLEKKKYSNKHKR